MTDTHLWDYTAVGALDKILDKFKKQGRSVTIKGLNPSSSKLIKKTSNQHKNGNLQLDK